ncbi:hypothetical protein EXU48_05160 [Occultella glacieicola]|uniref:DUF2510 domain-containing protein n=1 Tax=Occultella glacieicola TaxID=2518684 RepID=A0ABY2E9A7_9MICO|nr:hypothetical protein [Occultella glacieicola]TDE97572.1 hypothetical protein EXU48_05160 [Occultella glacieicola]
MSQRFNAPPGWQVPPNFTPPEGWQPDPSWPPAPAGWNYWVEDAAGSAAAPMAGQNPGYGPGSAAPAGGSPYGASPYGDAASGTASAALAQQEVKKARNGMLVGFGILAAAVLVFVISFAVAASSPTGGTYFFPWYFMLIGLILGIRGLIQWNKAKKAVAMAPGGSFDPSAYTGSGASGMPGPTTPPGVTPPGGYPTSGTDSGPRPGEYRP